MGEAVLRLWVPPSQVRISWKSRISGLYLITHDGHEATSSIARNVDYDMYPQYLCVVALMHLSDYLCRYHGNGNGFHPQCSTIQPLAELPSLGFHCSVLSEKKDKNRLKGGSIGQ